MIQLAADPVAFMIGAQVIIRLVIIQHRIRRFVMNVRGGHGDPGIKIGHVAEFGAGDHASFRQIAGVEAKIAAGRQIDKIRGDEAGAAQLALRNLGQQEPCFPLGVGRNGHIRHIEHRHILDPQYRMLEDHHLFHLNIRLGGMKAPRRAFALLHLAGREISVPETIADRPGLFHLPAGKMEIIFRHEQGGIRQGRCFAVDIDDSLHRVHILVGRAQGQIAPGVDHSILHIIAQPVGLDDQRLRVVIPGSPQQHIALGHNVFRPGIAADLIGGNLPGPGGQVARPALPRPEAGKGGEQTGHTFFAQQLSHKGHIPALSGATHNKRIIELRIVGTAD